MTTYPQPVVPVFPAGYGPVPADFDTWVQGNFGGLAVGAVLRATLSAGQSFTGGSVTTMAFNNILEDNWSGWNATSHEYLVPWTGLYEVTVTVNIAAQANGIEPCVLVSGNTLYELGDVTTPSGSVGGGVCGSVIVACIGGSDFIQGQARAGSTATAATGVTVLSSMEIRYVSS